MGSPLSVNYPRSISLLSPIDRLPLATPILNGLVQESAAVVDDGDTWGRLQSIPPDGKVKGEKFRQIQGEGIFSRAIMVVEVGRTIIRVAGSFS